MRAAGARGGGAGRVATGRRRLGRGGEGRDGGHRRGAAAAGGRQEGRAAAAASPRRNKRGHGMPLPAGRILLPARRCTTTARCATCTAAPSLCTHPPESHPTTMSPERGHTHTSLMSDAVTDGVWRVDGLLPAASKVACTTEVGAHVRCRRSIRAGRLPLPCQNAAASRRRPPHLHPGAQCWSGPRRCLPPKSAEGGEGEMSGAAGRAGRSAAAAGPQRALSGGPCKPHLHADR